MLSLSLFIQGSLWMMRLLFSIAKNVISDSLSKNYRNLLISTSHGHPIIKTKETGYLMCFLDALGLADICQQANHQHRQHFNMIPYDLQNLWLSWTYGRPDLMIVLILWLSTSYDCPDLMIVRYSCMLSFRSYGCPHLMVVHILWLSGYYGCPHLMIVRILWLSETPVCNLSNLMVVHILWLSETPVCNLSYLMVVHILWLSISYDCPDLMIVQYSCMLYFRSYGCPHLMVVQYKLISYGFILWYLMVVFWKKRSYGLILWLSMLMVVLLMAVL